MTPSVTVFPLAEMMKFVRPATFVFSRGGTRLVVSTNAKMPPWSAGSVFSEAANKASPEEAATFAMSKLEKPRIDSYVPGETIVYEVEFSLERPLRVWLDGVQIYSGGRARIIAWSKNCPSPSRLRGHAIAFRKKVRDNGADDTLGVRIMIVTSASDTVVEGYLLKEEESYSGDYYNSRRSGYDVRQTNVKFEDIGGDILILS